MPDICMCKGLEHPKCNGCYRKMAIPSEHRQAYFAEPPIQHPDSNNPICTWYSPIREFDRIVGRENK